MTATFGIADLERQWLELLKPFSLELRLAAIVELARAGVLGVVGVDLRIASIWAADLSEPGLWQRAEEILGLAEAPEGAPSEDAWSAWTTFCERSEPVDVPDYRTLLDERYAG